MSRVNKAEAENRKSIIHNMLCECFKTHEIIRICTEKWGIGSRQVEKYIEQCNERICSRKQASRDKRLSRALEEARHLYEKCLIEHDKKTGAQVLKHIHDLEGLLKTTLELSGQVEVSHMTPEQRRAKIDELIRKRGAPSN